jgi:hypothetical protein
MPRPAGAGTRGSAACLVPVPCDCLPQSAAVLPSQAGAPPAPAGGDTPRAACYCAAS